MGLIGLQRVLITLVVDPDVANGRMVLTSRQETPAPDVAAMLRDIAKHNPPTQSDLSFSTALALASGRKSRRGELKATNARVYINKSVSFGRRTGIRKKG